MNKFTLLIGSNGSKTLQNRAKNIADQAKIAQETLVNKLKTEKIGKELELSNLLDLAPDETTSLRPGGKDWNPTVWVDKVQSLKVDIYNISVELDLAEKTYKEYFVEEQSES